MKSSKRHNEVDLRVVERVGIPLIVFMLNAHCRDNDQGSRSSLESDGSESDGLQFMWEVQHLDNIVVVVMIKIMKLNILSSLKLFLFSSNST